MQRRLVIEAYAKYDWGKKQSPLPDFDTWDWSNADSIDDSMCRSHLKVGIPAGYLLWDQVEVTMADLVQSAVEAGIMPGQPRMLGDIFPDQLTYKPGKWHDQIIHGGTFDESRQCCCGGLWQRNPGQRGMSKMGADEPSPL